MRAVHHGVEDIGIVDVASVPVGGAAEFVPEQGGGGVGTFDAVVEVFCSGAADPYRDEAVGMAFCCVLHAGKDAGAVVDDIFEVDRSVGIGCDCVVEMFFGCFVIIE